MKILEVDKKENIYDYLNKNEFVLFYINNENILKSLIKKNFSHYSHYYHYNEYCLFYLHKKEIRFIPTKYNYGEKIYELSDFYNYFTL